MLDCDDQQAADHERDEQRGGGTHPIIYTEDGSLILRVISFAVGTPNCFERGNCNFDLVHLTT